MTTDAPDVVLLSWLAKRLPRLNPSLRPLRPEELLGFEKAQEKSPEQLKPALLRLIKLLSGKKSRWDAVIDESRLPCIALTTEGVLLLVHTRNPDNSWLCETEAGRIIVKELPAEAAFCRVPSGPEHARRVTAIKLFKEAMASHRGHFFQIAVLTVILNFIALVTSLYSMQVYDRVIPSQGVSTLIALSSGAVIAILLEMVGKFARSALTNNAVRSIDVGVSHEIFQRLLNIRLDQFPPGVGTLSAQLRSYESIRSFAMSATVYVLVDLPFALLFLAVIFLIGGSLVAVVPLVAFIIALVVGIYSRRSCERHTAASQAAANRKLGLLVEAVDGAESIKSSGCGWQFLSRWNTLTRNALNEDIIIRHQSESATYFAALIQQVAYIGLVGTGAYLAATSTSITTGGIIAASILSGRVLNPVTMLPGLMVQWANAKAALASIEGVFKLHTDNQGITHPLVLSGVQGKLVLENVVFSYTDRPKVISIPSLSIAAGEKVAIIGGVGSGKSTLLKLLAGLYACEKGRITLDDLDMAHISRPHLVQHIGYVPQDLRLFGGTLRENLLAGTVGATEENLINACRESGLLKRIAANPKGLDLQIVEGGAGLSGGQRQIVGVTRMLLKRPDIWLMDEPTASMDSLTENETLSALKAAIKPEHTVVLVTHKPSLLNLADRLIVMNNGQIMLDGPRDEVIARLAAGRAGSATAQNGARQPAEPVSGAAPAAKPGRAAAAIQPLPPRGGMSVLYPGFHNFGV